MTYTVFLDTGRRMAIYGVKTRAFPTIQEKRKLSQLVNCSGFIYNAKYTKQQYLLKSKHRFLGLTSEKIPQAYLQLDTCDTAFLNRCLPEISRNYIVIWLQATQRFLKGDAEIPQGRRRDSSRETQRFLKGDAEIPQGRRRDSSWLKI